MDMNDQPSANLYLNIILEKYANYKSKFISLLITLSENDQAKKVDASKELCDAASDLANILSEKDRPNWLKQTIIVTNTYGEQNIGQSVRSGGAWTLLQKLMDIYPKPALEYDWSSTSNGQVSGIDFDEVYRTYRGNSKIDKLFDSLIAVLKKMILCGDIDSITAVSALNELLETLKKNKDGSYFSTMASWEFAKSFTKNYVWEQLNSIPGVKPLQKAFFKTMGDMDLEMDKLHKNISDELKKKYQVKIQSTLKYRNSNQQVLEDKSSSE